MKRLFLLLPLFFFPASVNAELVNYWSFNEAVNSTAAVDSVHSNNALVNGTVTFGANGVFDSTAVTFSGTSESFLKLAKSIDCLYSGDNTFSLWVNPSSYSAAPNWTPIFGDWSSPHSFMNYINSSDGSLISYLSAAKDNSNTASTSESDFNRTTVSTSARSIPLNQWTNITISRDYESGVIRQYINGELKNIYGSDSLVSKNFMNYTELLFGAKGDQKSVVFNGLMDEARVYDQVLSNAQVKSLYQTNDISGASDTVAAVYQAPIHLEELIGTSKYYTMDEAMSFHPSAGAYASLNNLGVVQLMGGNSGKIMSGALDITGAGAAVNVESLGIKAGYYTGRGIEYNRTDGSRAMKIGGLTNGLGMHVNQLITFDLNELRAAAGYESDDWVNFSSIIGSNHTDGSTNVHMSVLVSDDSNNVLGAIVDGTYVKATQTDGVWSLSGVPTTYLTNSVTANVNVTLPGTARYLTLISTDANGSMSCDHGAFANPVLTAVPKEISLLQLAGASSIDNLGVLPSAPVAGTTITASSRGIVKSQNGGFATAVNLIGANTDAANGVMFDFSNTGISTGSSLGNGWGTIKVNQCGNDASAMEIPVGYENNGYIGMHANAILTVDIAEVRSMAGLADDEMFRFSTAAIVGHDEQYGTVNSIVLLSNKESGVIGAWWQGQQWEVQQDELGIWSLVNDDNAPTEISRGNPVDINLEITSNVDYLSLIMTCGAASTSDHAAYLNPLLQVGVPEPSTWAILILGVFGIAAFRRRKKYTRST